MQFFGKTDGNVLEKTRNILLFLHDKSLQLDMLNSFGDTPVVFW
jgi:hypothetical protein